MLARSDDYIRLWINEKLVHTFALYGRGTDEDETGL